jgi:glycosyltransferase involved in cell wall biosynthesis
MRLGFALLTLFPGRVGGAETYVRGLLEEYAAGNGPDAVTVLANHHVMNEYRRYERGPVRLHHVSSYRPGDGTVTRALAMATAALVPGLVRRTVPRDLDLVHNAVTVPIPQVGLRRVVTLHDVQHHDLPRLFSRAERAYRRWAYDGSARSADVVVTSSRHSKDRIVDLLGISPDRVEVVHLGIDRERFVTAPSPGDEEALAGLALPRRFVLYPANLWPHKNHDRLLAALALLEDRDIGLVLTGQTYGRLGWLREQARAAGVDARVRHLGHVPSTSVAALYRAADALVFPSLYEGFGAPPLEAMACGCPVAASDRTSIPEVCGDAALLFAPDSPESIAAALERVIGDQETRDRLRARGLERAAEFTWSAAAERHQAIYARAAAT